MKTPIPCHCGEYMMIDLQKDHQHLTCEECKCVWCLVCVDVTTWPEWMAPERIAQAHNN